MSFGSLFRRAQSFGSLFRRALSLTLTHGQFSSHQVWRHTFPCNFKGAQISQCSIADALSGLCPLALAQLGISCFGSFPRPTPYPLAPFPVRLYILWFFFPSDSLSFGSFPVLLRILWLCLLLTPSVDHLIPCPLAPCFVEPSPLAPCSVEPCP